MSSFVSKSEEKTRNILQKKMKILSCWQIWIFIILRHEVALIWMSRTFILFLTPLHLIYLTRIFKVIWKIFARHSLAPSSIETKFHTFRINYHHVWLICVSCKLLSQTSWLFLMMTTMWLVFHSIFLFLIYFYFCQEDNRIKFKNKLVYGIFFV